MNFLADSETLRETPYGERRFAISVFDHWLTEAEAASGTPLFFYQQAVDTGRLEEFLAEEQRALGLYRRLAASGAAQVRAPGVLTKPLRADSRQLKEIVVASHRDWVAWRSHRGPTGVRFMDLYFFEYDVRVLGSWDRTDQLFAGPRADVQAVEALVRAAGLFVLR